jgi:rhodanese-related sulfurtransferase
VQATFDAAEASPRPGLRVTADELLALIRPAAGGGGGGGGGGGAAAGGGVVVLDTRSAEQYAGEARRRKRPSVSPGAARRLPLEGALGPAPRPSPLALNQKPSSQPAPPRAIHPRQVRRGPRGGRVPGAASLPRRALCDATTGAPLPLARQRQILSAALGFQLPASPASTAPGGAPGGGDGGPLVVIYCNGGVAACTAALAIQRLGHARWAVYDGSWNEWGARAELPAEAAAHGG